MTTQPGLVLDPSNELKFRGPFDDVVTVNLTVTNTSQSRIAFKIKTTAPKRYCVKPNSGVLDPLNTMKVQVLLQPFSYDPNEKSKHKFMVQYLFLSEEEAKMSTNDVLNMWKDVQPERLLDVKLKCIFDFNDDESKAPKSTINESIISTNKTFEEAPTSTTMKVVKIDAPTVSAAPTASLFTSSQEASPILHPITPKTQHKISEIDRSNSNESESVKQLRTENEKLKKEIEHLRSEESRLKKLALASDAGKMSRHGSSSAHAGFDLSNPAELLQNKTNWIIILLIAIIIYLYFKS